MIDWDAIHKLHAVRKIEEIISNWFNADCIYADSHYRIKNELIRKEEKNLFLKVQMELEHGKEILSQDIETAVDLLNSTNEKIITIKETFFKPVKALAVAIQIDGELIGIIMAYPIIGNEVTASEKNNLIDRLNNVGSDPGDIREAIDSLKKVNKMDEMKIKELLSLMAEEISEFQEVKNKKDTIINEMSSELSERFRYHDLMGRSRSMQKVYAMMDKIKDSESNVFVQGENGTGKELIAKAIHYNSPRKDRLFLAINCSALNDNLLDSELFGHVKGSFTGAIKDKKGLFEMADAGTLFLDEVGDTSLSMQVKLLRVLQEGTYIPVGGTSAKKVDVRVICATNRNLNDLMSDGRFREDLFYRINVINITLPPLRERVGDIDLLVEYFIKKRCDEIGKVTKELSKEVKQYLLDYNWPGNVRELENEIERLVVLSGDSQTIEADNLSSRVTQVVHTAETISSGVNLKGKMKKAVEELERIMIADGLRRCNYNKSKLSKELGISRASLIQKVEKYELDKKNAA